MENRYEKKIAELKKDHEQKLSAKEEDLNRQKN